MQTYSELSTQVVQNASIAVMVLMNESNTDVELLPLLPRKCEFPSKDEFTARKLRSVGVIALCGAQSNCALKEPLENEVVDAIAATFLEYVRVLIGPEISRAMAAAEIAEMERMYTLPDTRSKL